VKKQEDDSQIILRKRNRFDVSQWYFGAGIACIIFGVLALLCSILFGSAWIIVGIISVILGILTMGIAGLVSKIIKSSYDKFKTEILTNKERREKVLDYCLQQMAGQNYGEEGIIIDLIGDIGDKRATQYLTLALKYPYTTYRIKAICAIEKIKDENAAESLLALLDDNDKTIQQLAKTVIGRLHWDSKMLT
jgi:hypothetical protein